MHNIDSGINHDDAILDNSISQKIKSGPSKVTLQQLPSHSKIPLAESQISTSHSISSVHSNASSNNLYKPLSTQNQPNPLNTAISPVHSLHGSTSISEALSKVKLSNFENSNSKQADNTMAMKSPRRLNPVNSVVDRQRLASLENPIDNSSIQSYSNGTSINTKANSKYRQSRNSSVNVAGS